MTRACARCLASLFTLLALPALAAPAQDDAVVKPLKTVVGSVRYGKDLAALKQFAGEEQGKFLLGADWDKGTSAQRKEFVELFHLLFAKLAFPKIRENFKHLETVTYDAPKLDSASAEVGSVIVILHPLKKQELKVKYRLTQTPGQPWKVVDASVLGDSMLTGIRDDQIRPILQEGGWPHLLELMRTKAKELESVPLK